VALQTHWTLPVARHLSKYPFAFSQIAFYPSTERITALKQQRTLLTFNCSTVRKT